MEEMGRLMLDLDFYRGRRVLVTGHTGFKGSWTCRVLKCAGAEVTGFSLPSPTSPSLFELAGIGEGMRSVMGDVRDIEALERCFETARPEIVLHLAAQPIVRDGYKDPRYTYETNVMGTVNVLECVRRCESVRSFLNVTTDKVYKNNEWVWGYRESDELCGFDPYSNSKSCSELVTFSYKSSFFSDHRAAISTVRAGNVIGGGDFAPDRIVPDCVRAAVKGRDILVRNPYSTRPYQHVLEPVFAYLMIARAQYEDASFAGCYNVGPDERDCVSTGELTELFCREWGGVRWINEHCGGPHEAGLLKLDCSRLKSVFGWRPVWSLESAVRAVVEWSRVWHTGGNVGACMDTQIDRFLSDCPWVLG